MSLVRYSPRRRDTQCLGNADSTDEAGTPDGKLDPISLERLEGMVVKLGSACYFPATISKSLRRFKRDPFTNEYVRMAVRNRIHGFAGEPPEDVDIFGLSAAFIRENIHLGDDRLQRELDRLDVHLNNSARLFGDGFFKFVAENMLVDPDTHSDVLRKYFISDIETAAKDRLVIRSMLQFENAFKDRAATPAEVCAFGRKIFSLRYDAGKSMLKMLQIFEGIRFKDETDQPDSRRQIRRAERFIEDAESLGFV